MRLAKIQSPADWRRPDPRQRALIIGLTLLAETLFLLMLLGLGPASWSERKDKSTPTEVVFVPEAAAPVPDKAAPEAASKATKQKPVERVPPIPPSPLAKSPYLKLTREEYAAADISNLGSAGGQGSAASGASSASVGTGPGGATLYLAEWYRKPTHAELAYYLPKDGAPQGSWAEVVCKTIPDNRVENCQALGESPPGSGLARAIRLAGWQFRIRPTRIDGKPLIGTWVKVHIDFTRGGE